MKKNIPDQLCARLLPSGCVQGSLRYLLLLIHRQHSILLRSSAGNHDYRIVSYVTGLVEQTVVQTLAVFLVEQTVVQTLTGLVERTVVQILPCHFSSLKFLLLLLYDVFINLRQKQP